MDYYAHTGPAPSDWQRLRVHLAGVATLAKCRARDAVGDREGWLVEAAHAAGLLHDLGKYRMEFQKYLEGKSVPAESRYHKETGAAKAVEAKLWPLAFVIAGHHGGLPSLFLLNDSLDKEAGKAAAKEVWAAAIADCPALATALERPPPVVEKLRLELLTRVLFSCLVDADWADTAEHERSWSGRAPDPIPPPLDPADRLERLQRAVAAKAEAARGSGVTATSPEVAERARGCLSRVPRCGRGALRAVFADRPDRRRQDPLGPGLRACACEETRVEEGHLRCALLDHPRAEREGNPRGTGPRRRRSGHFRASQPRRPAFKARRRRRGGDPSRGREPPGRELGRADRPDQQRHVFREPLREPAATVPQGPQHRQERHPPGRVPDLAPGVRRADLRDAPGAGRGPRLDRRAGHRHPTGVRSRVVGAGDRPG